MKLKVFKSLLSLGLLVSIVFIGACEKNVNTTESDYLPGTLEDWSIRKVPGGCTIIEYKGDQIKVVFPTIVDGINVVGIGGMGNVFATLFTDDVITVDLRKMKFLKYIDNDAFFAMRNLSKVYLTNSIESIGDRAFLYDVKCEFLTGLPRSLTHIGNSAFSFCYKLTEVDVPEAVKNLSEGCFSSCTGLTKVTFHAGLERLNRGCFAGGERIKELVFPSTVVLIAENAFIGCASVTEIEINEGCESVGEDSFRSCTSLTKVVLPKSVVEIGDYAFAECRLLTEFEIRRDAMPLTSVDWFTFSQTPQSGLQLTVTYPVSTTYPTEPVWEDFPFTWVPK